MERPQQIDTLELKPNNADGVVRLSDVMFQKELESQLCITNTSRLVGLQDWVTAQNDVERR